MYFTGSLGNSGDLFCSYLSAEVRKITFSGLLESRATRYFNKDSWWNSKFKVSRAIVLFTVVEFKVKLNGFTHCKTGR